LQLASRQDPVSVGYILEYCSSTVAMPHG